MELALCGLVLVGVAALVVVATCYVIVRVVRRVPVNRLIALVAVGPTLVWTSHGVWNVTVNALGMSPTIAVFAFLVFEAMLVNAGYGAEQHRRQYGIPGPHARYVWRAGCRGRPAGLLDDALRARAYASPGCTASPPCSSREDWQD